MEWSYSIYELYFFFLNSGENSKASQDIVQPKTARNSIEGKQIKGAPRPLHHTH